MNEIKFRWVFKNKENGEFKYSEGSIIGLMQNKVPAYYVEEKFEFVSQDLYVFTDKNDVEVYEGDIIQDSRGGLLTYTVKTFEKQVLWYEPDTTQEHAYVINGYALPQLPKFCEKIGNKYEQNKDEQ